MEAGDRFFERPILNSPYEYPSQHWELDESSQPTNQVLPRRRQVSFITPIPKPKKSKGAQQALAFDEEAQRVATEGQQYELAQTINSVRNAVDRWRELPDQGQWRVTPETARAIRLGNAPKGDVLQAARLAGIMAAKRTAELIPLCHPLPGTTIAVELEVDEALPGVRAQAEAVVDASTGVEMEALTAVAVALLTVYDMAKALDRSMEIGSVRLLAKEGGRSGAYRAPEPGG